MPNTIDSTGFDKVRFQDLRAEKAQEYKDTFDNQNLKTDVRSGVGQEVSLSTKAEDDLASTFQTLLSVFDPLSAQGVHLDRLLILMNKKRQDAVGSTATITITADASGATITKPFLISDGVNDYAIDSDLTIAPNSSDTVEATCTVTGPIESAAGTITEIKTPLFGVVSAVNLADANVGRNRESDAEARNRALQSSANESSTLVGIFTALSNVDGVIALKVIENDTDVVDSIGVPPHSVFPIADGGSDDDIAKALITGGVAAGIGYAEDSDIPAATIVSGTYSDPITGQTFTAYWARPDDLRVYVNIKITKLSNYPADGDERVKQAISDYVGSTLTIGDDLYASQLYCAIQSVDGAVINVGGGDYVYIGTTANPIGTTLVAATDYEVVTVGSSDVVVV